MGTKPRADDSHADKEEAVSRLASELNLLQGVAENLQKQIELMNRTILEIGLTSATLEKLEKLDVRQKVLVSIGSGSFITAETTEVRNTILNIGAGAAIEKTFLEARQILQTRAATYQNHADRLRDELDKILERINIIQPQLQEMLQEG